MNQDDRGGNKKAAARGGMRLLRLLATAQDSYLVGRRPSHSLRRASKYKLLRQCDFYAYPQSYPYKC
jgi:hypothetical protein